MITVQEILEFNKLFIKNNPVKSSLSSVLSAYVYYEDDKDKIMSIVFGIIKGHHFADANKRTGVLVLLYLSEKLNLELANDDVIFDIIVGIASGKYNIEQVKLKLFK